MWYEFLLYTVVIFSMQWVMHIVGDLASTTLTVPFMQVGKLRLGTS